eukprot:5991570-Prymnesium_polylepis.1
MPAVSPPSSAAPAHDAPCHPAPALSRRPVHQRGVANRKLGVVDVRASFAGEPVQECPLALQELQDAEKPAVRYTGASRAMDRLKTSGIQLRDRLEGEDGAAPKVNYVEGSHRGARVAGHVWRRHGNCYWCGDAPMMCA